MTATAFVTPPRKFMVFYGFGLFIAGYCIWFMRDDVVVGGARRNSFVGEIGDRIFGGVFFDFRATRNSCPRQRFVTVLVAGSGMDGFFEHHHTRVSLSSRLRNSKYWYSRSKWFRIVAIMIRRNRDRCRQAGRQAGRTGLQSKQRHSQPEDRKHRNREGSYWICFVYLIYFLFFLRVSSRSLLERPSRIGHSVVAPDNLSSCQ